MTEAPLPVGQGHGTQIVAVELHEIESPWHDPILGTLIHAPMQLPEAIHVHELGGADEL
jgi:hypothetical protein